MEKMQFADMYRPQKLEDMIGQNDAVTQVKGMLKKGLPNCLLINGKSGCGKCVEGNTLINTNKGLIKIKDLIREKGYQLNSDTYLRLQNMHGVWEKPSHTYKRKDYTIYVEDKYGYNIEGSYVHPILTICPKGFLKWTKLEDLTKEYYLVHSLTQQKWNDRQVSIGDTNIFNRNRATNGREVIAFKASSRINITVATLLGLIVSEGTLSSKTVEITNKDKNIISLFKNSLSKLDNRVNFYKKETRENKTPKVGIKKCYNILKYFEKTGLNYGHCRGVELPYSILQSPKEIQVAFLRAYFEGDGGWEGGNITCCSASLKLLKQLQVMLLNFGIVAKRRIKIVNEVKYYVLYIGGLNVDIYMQNIGFLSTRKNTAYVKKSKNTNVFVLPKNIINRFNDWKTKQPCSGSGYYLNRFGDRVDLGRMHGIFSVELWKKWFDLRRPELLNCDAEMQNIVNDFDYILKNNCFISKVKIIKRSKGKKWLYDFTLPLTHSFLGGGFVNHNTTIARIIANMIVGKHVGDIHDITFGGEEKRGIDKSREIAAEAQFAPRGKYAVFCIDELARATKDAFTPFLKLLEEPPKQTIFILITDEPEKLPITILNRCYKINLKSISPDDLKILLKKVAKLEKIEFSSTKIINYIANNAPEARTALQMLQQARDAQVDQKNYKEVLKVLKIYSEGVDRVAVNVLLALYLGRRETLFKYLFSDPEPVSFLNSCLNYNAWIMRQMFGANTWRNDNTDVILKYLKEAPKSDKITHVHNVLINLRTVITTISSFEQKHIILARLGSLIYAL